MIVSIDVYQRRPKTYHCTTGRDPVGLNMKCLCVCVCVCIYIYIYIYIYIGKTVPLQAWSGPEGSGKLRFPDFMTTAQGGCKVVSLTHRPPLPPGNAPGTNFC